MIPKVIHFCWFGGKPLPQDVKKCIASWKKYCPDFEIRQWSEDNFDVTAHPFMRAAYEAKAWAFVADVARLLVVARHGGIYMDTDVELKKPLEPLLSHSCYVGLQQVGCCVNTGIGFGAEAEHPAVLAMLSEYDKVTFDPEKKQELACPNLNHSALVPFGVKADEQIQHLPQLTVYPCRYFDPLAPGDHASLMCKDTVSVHHYSASWLSPWRRFRRKVVHLIGQERIAKLRGVLKR